MISVLTGVLATLVAQEAVAPIQDNSFLMEEAYNQEPGVVQHISTLLRPRGGGTWSYSFTQEWPALGQRHQLSYTVPIEHGVGDVAVNYRHQLIGIGGAGRVALAPRVSALVPTQSGRSTALQMNVPLSLELTRHAVTHWNGGATLMRSDGPVYNAGASAIWLVRPLVNLMLEVTWTGTAGSGETIVSPGVRWAHNLGRLQIVPGIAFPIDHGTFFYLSFEHPFKSSGPARAL